MTTITATPRPPPPAAMRPPPNAPPRPPRPRSSRTSDGSSCESSRNDMPQPAIREARATRGVYGPSVTSDISAEEACRDALERLEAENPRVNAVVAWDGERALAEARERDGLPHVWRGPLHGIPFTAKDLTDATPYPTTYGSLAFADNLPGADATCVARLRRAGAVLVGKTNTPEMGARP